MEDISYTFGLYVAESIFITPFPFQKCLETSYHPEAVGCWSSGHGLWIMAPPLSNCATLGLRLFI